MPNITDYCDIPSFDDSDIDPTDFVDALADCFDE